MSDVRIISPLPDAQREPAAELYWEAFKGKLRGPLGPPDRARRFLTRVLDADHAIAAIDCDGTLLGVAGYKSDSGTFVGGTLSDLAAIYGWFGATWRAAVLAFLERETEPGVLVMDGICVAATARGRGIGTMLLKAILDHARVSGHQTVRLDVIDNNSRARALYERMGFAAVGDTRLGLLAPIFGFRVSTRMHHDIAGAAT